MAVHARLAHLDDNKSMGPVRICEEEAMAAHACLAHLDDAELRAIGGDVIWDLQVCGHRNYLTPSGV